MRSVGTDTHARIVVRCHDSLLLHAHHVILLWFHVGSCSVLLKIKFDAGGGGRT